MNNFYVTGETDSEGNLFIHGKDMLKNYCEKHPDSKFTIQMERVDIESGSGLLRFYYVHILPQVQEGFKTTGAHYTLKEIDQLLRSQYCGTVEEVYEGDKLIKRLKNINDVDKESVLYFFDYVRIYCAENLNMFIQEPRVLLKI